MASFLIIMQGMGMGFILRVAPLCPIGPEGGGDVLLDDESSDVVLDLGDADAACEVVTFRSDEWEDAQA